MSRKKNIFFHFLCCGLLFAYPYLKFIGHHDYPFFRPEVLVILGGWLAGSLTFCLLFYRRPPLIALAYAILILLLLTSGPHSIKPTGLYLRGFGCFLIFLFFWRAPQRVLPIMGLFLAGMVFSDGIMALGKPSSPPPPVLKASPVKAPADKPHHVLYLIFDEHIGVEGMPVSVPGTGRIKRELEDFYRSHGFTLFSRAFSNYFYTDNSVSNILNGTYADRLDFYFSGSPERSLKQNRFFDFYRQQGYDIRVYQTDYLNYCPPEQPVTECTPLRRNSIKAVENLSYSKWEKMWVIGSLFMGTNSVFQEIEKRSRDRGWFKLKTAGLRVVPEFFEKLKKDLDSSQNNTLFFGHILIPHYPYVYDSQCRPRPVRDWMERSEFREEHKKNRPEGYARRYSFYYEQEQCLYRHLGDLTDFLKEKGLYDPMAIVFWGDHGSRINLDHEPYYDYYSQISTQDMVTSHSALLAVKKPHQTVGLVSREMGDVNEILRAEFWEGKTFRDDGNHFVFLKQKKGKKELIKVPMPEF